MSAAPETQAEKMLFASAQRLHVVAIKLSDAVRRADITNPAHIEYIKRLQKKLNSLQVDFAREMSEVESHLRSLENTEGDKDYRGAMANQLTGPSNENNLGEELFLKKPSASGGAGGGASAAAGPANALALNASVATGLSKKRTRRSSRSRKNSRSRRPKN
jgi:hypothetical protein